MGGPTPTTSPGTADLAGLPPTLVITNECNTLRDEGELLAARMQEQAWMPGRSGSTGWPRRVLDLAAVARCDDQRPLAADFLMAQLSRKLASVLV